MSKIQLTATLLFFFGIYYSVLAQEKCGSMDLLHSYLNKQNDINLAQFKQQINQPIKKNKAAKNREVFTIPVVVHVVYRTPFQNISDETIYDGMAVLNEDFRALNNLSNIYEEFKDDAADAEIEFCLANVDPNGNPTKGINRIKTEIDDFGENYEEDKIKFTDEGGADAWPTRQYLNIWIGDISGNGLLGYAQFPMGGESATDGVVIDDYSFGRAGGRSNVVDDGTVSHEIGHWLGLFHIWGDDCRINDNDEEVCACVGSDGIADTNNSKGPASGCKKQTNTCGSPDMIQNFMDYSNCSDFFTKGQVDVMRSFLEADGFRSALTTSGKCAELMPNDLAVIDIAFPAKNEVVCTQNFRPAIQFTNNGSDTLKQATFKILINDNKEFTADWTGELLFADYATVELTEITGNIGSQKISVRVESINGVEDMNEDNNVKEQNFQIKLLEAAHLPFRENFEDDLNEWAVNNMDEEEGFKLTDKLSHFGEQCIELNNFSIEESGRAYELSSPNLNIASYTEPELQFFYASANKRTEPGFDELVVLFTNDCGVHFDTIFHKIGDELATATKTDEAFEPANSQWKRAIVDLDAYKDETFANLHFKFISGLGNNFYLDDISVIGKEPNPTGIFNAAADYNVVISPNPFQQQINLTIPNEYLTKKINIIMYDALGKQVKYLANLKPENQINFTVEDLTEGIFYIHLQIDQNIHLIQKIIKL